MPAHKSAAPNQAVRSTPPGAIFIRGFNMWVGVSHAGYTVRDELPIMLLLFAFRSTRGGRAFGSVESHVSVPALAAEALPEHVAS